MESEINYQEIINAATYEDICDYSIIPPEGKVFIDEILDKNCVIFCKTDFVGLLFDRIRYSDKKYVLVTHHSDYSINYNLYSFKPECIIKWFAINVEHDDPNLISIPLGIKTHKGIYLEGRYMTKWFVENLKILKDIPKQNIIYCNWTDTNSFRNSIIEKLEKNKLNFKLENNLSFDKYITNMSSCKYVISPPGNGIDCHRTWEALYMGCIPIVIKNRIYESWKDLPILQVEDYSELSIDLLNNFCEKNFDKEKLYLGYWKKLIRNNIW